MAFRMHVYGTSERNGRFRLTVSIDDGDFRFGDEAVVADDPAMRIKIVSAGHLNGGIDMRPNGAVLTIDPPTFPLKQLLHKTLLSVEGAETASA